jgi:choline dehydrogenase
MNIEVEMEFYQLINLKTKIHYLKHSSISAGEAGYKINEDMNGKDPRRFWDVRCNYHKGERASVSKYYLNPAKKRKNLKVFTDAFVEKIIFDGKKAIGIEGKN